jgi:hypothetical protein
LSCYHHHPTHQFRQLPRHLLVVLRLRFHSGREARSDDVGVYNSNVRLLNIGKFFPIFYILLSVLLLLAAVTMNIDK